MNRTISCVISWLLLCSSGNSASAYDQGDIDGVVGCISQSRIDSWALKARAFHLGRGKKGPELLEAHEMGKDLLNEAQIVRMCLTTHRKQALESMNFEVERISLFNQFEEAARHYAGRAVPYGRSPDTYLDEMQKASVAYTDARDRMLSDLQNRKVSGHSATPSESTDRESSKSSRPLGRVRQGSTFTRDLPPPWSRASIATAPA